MPLTSADVKAAGYGKPQRPAEGLIPLQSVQDNARRDVRERGGGAQGLYDPYTGLPVPDTSQPGPGAAYARNLTRAFFTQADFGNVGAFSDNPTPEAMGRIEGFNLAHAGVPDNALSAYGRGDGRGPEVGPGSPVDNNALASRARAQIGFGQLGGDVLEGLSYSGIPGVSTVAGGLSLANSLFGPLPGVVGGEIAPKPLTQGFRDVVGANRAARAMRSLASRGNRSIGGTGL
jgi:hypothetical protein